MNKRYLVTYHDPSSDEQYEAHATSKEEAEEVREELKEEGWTGIRVSEIRE